MTGLVQALPATEDTEPTGVDQPCPRCAVREPQNCALVMTPHEVAAALRVHPQTVYRWIRDGVLAVLPKGKAQYVVPVTEVQRLLKEAVDKAAARRAELGVAS